MRWIWSDELADVLAGLGIEVGESLRRSTFGVAVPEGEKAALSLGGLFERGDSDPCTCGGIHAGGQDMSRSTRNRG